MKCDEGSLFFFFYIQEAINGWYGRQNSEMVLQIASPLTKSSSNLLQTNLTIALKVFTPTIKVANQMTLKEIIW